MVVCEVRNASNYRKKLGWYSRRGYISYILDSIYLPNLIITLNYAN